MPNRKINMTDDPFTKLQSTNSKVNEALLFNALSAHGVVALKLSYEYPNDDGFNQASVATFYTASTFDCTDKSKDDLRQLLRSPFIYRETCNEFSTQGGLALTKTHEMSFTNALVNHLRDINMISEEFMHENNDVGTKQNSNAGADGALNKCFARLDLATNTLTPVNPHCTTLESILPRPGCR